jgi:hypothetical protein
MNRQKNTPTAQMAHLVLPDTEIIGQIDPLKSLQIDPPFEGTKLECLKSG